MKPTNEVTKAARAAHPVANRHISEMAETIRAAAQYQVNHTSWDSIRGQTARAIGKAVDAYTTFGLDITAGVPKKLNKLAGSLNTFDMQAGDTKDYSVFNGALAEAKSLIDASADTDKGHDDLRRAGKRIRRKAAKSNKLMREAHTTGTSAYFSIADVSSSSAPLPPQAFYPPLIHQQLFNPAPSTVSQQHYTITNPLPVAGSVVSPYTPPVVAPLTIAQPARPRIAITTGGSLHKNDSGGVIFVSITNDKSLPQNTCPGCFIVGTAPSDQHRFVDCPYKDAACHKYAAANPGYFEKHRQNAKAARATRQ